MSVIDRNKPLSFTFDGEPFQGFAGDTLASALIRNGVKLVGRSFKYHRPRGIFTAGSDEPNALVTLLDNGHSEPNRQATTLPLWDGLSAKSQNHMGSLSFDMLAVNDFLSPFLSAGFYYKTFMWPRKFWEWIYEPAIRRAAGLGALSDQPDPDTYDKGDLHCDVLIIGAGPAGLQAALNLGRAGKRIILADENIHFGGRLLSDNITINDMPGADWAAAVIAELRTLPKVRIIPRTTVFGVYDHGTYGALEINTDRIGAPGPRMTMWRIHAAHSILASGASERSIAFPSNDRPGIMLAGAARTYAHQYEAPCGTNPVILTNNDSTSGMDAARIIDTRNGDWVSGTHGRKGIQSITLNSGERIKTDSLLVSGGWSPNLQLTCHKRGRPVWNADKACFLPNLEALPDGMSVIGSANGNFSTHAAMRDADFLSANLGARTNTPPDCNDAPSNISAFWHAPGKGRAWVDLQNDVTAKDITLAHQEGFSSVEHVKRYTTLGMATDQGKTSNVLGLAILADAAGQSILDTGTTIFRPPYTPVPMGAFAGPHRGQHFKPIRLTPSHQYAEEIGATFVETGLWKRAQWFVRDREQGWRDSVDREVLMTRGSVGICDVSTLGKIDIQGRDAGKFLNLVYANTFSTLKVGKCRYGLMLREDGIAMDDGTTARLSETHFIMTTTTANAGKVFQHLEFVRQCLTPDLDVHLMSITDGWAQYAVAGPNARKLLEKIVDPEFDISNEVFPYMACGAVTVCGGTRARLFRLSFSGELAYEISVPARYGDSFIRALMQAGEEFDACLYGTEALGIMRIEKGHAAGNELNGTTTALNLGLGGFVSKKKDCIGKVMAGRDGLIGDDALNLVGFIPVCKDEHLTNGAHFFEFDAIDDIDEPGKPEDDQGYMTSVAWSPMLETYIGLGYLKNGRSRMGEELLAADYVRCNHVDVRVVSPHFFNPDGGRLRV